MIYLNNFHFLTIALFIAILISWGIALWRFYKLRELSRKKYPLLFWNNRSLYSQNFFLYIALLFVSIGLFDIHYHTRSSETNTINSIDLVFVLDVSKSMNSLDIMHWEEYVSRLNGAKTFIKNTISQYPEHRYGLVIFAGEAVSVSPLIDNNTSIIHILDSVNYQNISVQWSDFETAIQRWIMRFWHKDNNSDNSKKQLMVLLSDGWDTPDTINYEQLRTLFETTNISTLVIWTWNTNLVPIPNGINNLWETIFHTHNGETVLTQRNDLILEKLADNIQWEYAQYSQIDTWNIIQKHFSKYKTYNTDQNMWNSISQWLALCALISFLLSIFYYRK